jgi:hypothetical protein
MKRLLLLPALLALVLAGCETLNQADREMLYRHHVSEVVSDKMVHGEPLAVADFIELSKRGVPDGFVIRYLRSTYAVYNLTTAQVLRLRRGGVSDDVIDYLLQTPRMFGPRYYPYDPYFGIGPYYPYYYPYGFYGYPGFFYGSGYRYRYYHGHGGHDHRDHHDSHGHDHH